MAVLDTCKLANKGAQCEWVLELLKETARHELLSLYSPDHMWWPENQSKTFGGWNGGLLDTTIRNDFVQHNMSSILGLERHLREADGVDLPGGPRWTTRNLEGATYPGVPEAQMETLREWTLHYRGETRWEQQPAAKTDDADTTETPTEPTE